MSHELPQLPYDPDALEPYVDVQTMILHHDQHHAAYVKNLNIALQNAPGLQELSLSWLLQNPRKLPAESRDAVLHNAGGHINHCLFWRAMSPEGGGAPSGLLADAIDSDFGSFDEFKKQFEEAGAKVFGSGWVWLVRVQKDGGKLQVYTTSGHDNPMMRGHYPLLVNDVWEHAYYLKHANRRVEYLKSWWEVANWQEAGRRFSLSDQSTELDRENEGGMVPEMVQR